MDPATSAAAPPPEATRRASVLLLFEPTAPGLPLLFVLRSAGLRFHAGQIAFPGGGEEPGDAGVVATALREAHEEVGLQPDNADVLGLLPPLITATSDRWLTPVVALQREPFDIRSDGFEVADWFRLRLRDIAAAPHSIRTLERDGHRRQVHFYEVEGRTVWGVTAAILHELLQRLDLHG